MDDEIPLDLFEEPQDFRPPSPQPTIEYFKRCQGIGPLELVVNLPPKHSLWGHVLWNAGKSMTNYLDRNIPLYKNKKVLELGAAASLPSLVCAMNGAELVVSTDYPDPHLLKNIKQNCLDNCPELLEKKFLVRGHIWGQETELLLNNGKFDLILLADLIFNHTEHTRMLKTCIDVLDTNGIILTTFSHHVAKFADRDLKFFEHAQEMGFKYEKLYTEEWDFMFKDDVGDPALRKNVQCYKLWFKNSEE